VSPGRKHVRIMYAAQTGVAPPSFVFFTNVATTFHFSYERFLVNQIREKFGFIGSPIRIQVRRRERIGGSGPRKEATKRTDQQKRKTRTVRKDRQQRKDRTARRDRKGKA
jgi:hypothetical protein